MTEKSSGRVRPIRPGEVDTAKEFPDAVIEVFNELIVENYRGSSAHIRQAEVVARLVKRGLGREEIFDRGWLDVENIYTAAGWKVEYDKPGFNEEGEAIFTFISVR